MIEKILKQIKDTNPEEIKSIEVKPNSGTYGIYFIEFRGFKFELKSSLGGDYCSSNSGSFRYDLDIYKNGEVIQTFSNFWQERVNGKLLKEAYEETKKKFIEYTEQKEKLEREKYRRRKKKALKELSSIF